MRIHASSMIKASLISDAASMPLHWIYNQDIILEKLGENALVDSSFFPTPSCPYYSYPFGVYSPYGDESIPIMRSLSSVGAYEHDDVATKMVDFFSIYTEKTIEKDYVGRLSHVPTLFLEARRAGKPWEECNFDDYQAYGIAKVPLIVARYAGSPELETHIKSLVQILQKNELSLESSVLVGKLLERILLHSESPSIALENLLHSPGLSDFQKNVISFVTSDSKIRQWVSLIESLTATDPTKIPKLKAKLLLHFFRHHGDSLQEAIETVSLEVEDFEFLQASYNLNTISSDVELTPMRIGKAIGMSCALPDALVNALYVIRKANNLQEAIHWNTLMGGDNCSRSLVIGAAFGAAGDALPASWTNSISSHLWNELQTSADKIASDNPNLK